MPQIFCSLNRLRNVASTGYLHALFNCFIYEFILIVFFSPDYAICCVFLDFFACADQMNFNHTENKRNTHLSVPVYVVSIVDRVSVSFFHLFYFNVDFILSFLAFGLVFEMPNE